MGGEEGLGVTTGQPNLYKQDLSKLDVSKLTALSREVISRQATINIGTIGHVAHGKSTIVKAISGVQTVRFKNELERNITIKLDTRAEDSTKGEQEDNLGNMNKIISSTQEKRPASPGYVQPLEKHRKLNENIVFSEEDSHDDSAESTSNSSSSYSLFKQNNVNRRISRRSSYYSKSKMHSVDNIRVNKSNSNTDIERYQIKYNLGNVKLKELKVILKDIKYDTKQGMESLLSGSDFWEVERIISKKIRKNVPMYLIKWKNWDSQYNTWEPASNLINCPDILEQFETNRLKCIDRFKKKANFYPNDRDIEEYFKQLKYNGKTLESITTEMDEVFSRIRNITKQKCIRNSRSERAVKCDILHMLVIESREKQLKSLKDWENEMNIITKGKPSILVENIVDLEGAPQDFYYIEEYLPGNGVIIPDDPPIGCECNTCNFKTKCCFSQDSGYCPYTSACKIRVPPGTPIYECNKRCTCDMKCINRVVQRGSDMKLCIFRTANGRGWGVKTLQWIKKGTFVTEYVGEVITSEEANQRGKKYDAAGRTYLFDLDYNETEEECPYTVDAAVYGNISHFINHSCDPNLAVYGVWINCLDPNLPKLALFATRDIRKNEEITFDYTCQSSKNNENFIKQDVSLKENLDTENDIEKEYELRPETPESDLSINKTLCKCGAQNCRRYLF